MNQDDLKAITTVVASADFPADRLWLNGVCVGGDGKRRKAYSACLHLSRVRAPMALHPLLWLPRVARCREEDITRNGRVQDVLREIRARAGDRADASGRLIPAAELARWRVHIVSRNTFPTAAGLASSAAGYACLVHTLADVYGVRERFPGEPTRSGAAD
jgi:diphosphomevalonate decarboxylase